MIAEGLIDRIRPRRHPNGVVSSGARRRPRRDRVLNWRPHPRLLLLLAALLVLVLAGWFWVRDSSLVAVKRVTVTGVSGPDAGRIRTALRAAARTMTTLDVKMGRLNMAVAPYPVVRSLRVSTQFPHGMRIDVIEQVPVAAISIAGRTVAVAGDGTLLHDARVARALPTISVQVPPGGSRLTDPQALGEVAVLAAAPYQLLARVGQVSSSAAHGVQVQLRNGPVIYFGGGERLDAKWLAVTAVLSDGGSAGASYIDVSDPRRPAAGAASTAAPGSGSAAAAASNTATPGG